MLRFPVATMASGAEIAVILHELCGTKGDGPTVGICAAIHGNEPTGTEIILEIARLFKECEFRGRLILLPVANPLAFEANSRNTPLDDVNMNRVFPGNPGGWFTDHLAQVVTDEFLTKIDVLIDLHAGGAHPTVDYVYIRNAENLSRGFGSPMLYRADPSKSGTIFDGTSVDVTESRGVPSVTVELGGGVIDQTPYTKRGIVGIKNILSILEMIDDAPVPPPDQTVLNGITTVRPTQGGFLESVAVDLGKPVSGDSLLGRVVSPYTFEVLEEIANPVPDGYLILSHLTRNLVHPGDYGYMVGSAE
jgi:predicted deacylase